jgi:hypothetical protein
MELMYLQMSFVVMAGVIAIIGGIAYQGIRIYFLIKKNIGARKEAKRG